MTNYGEISDYDAIPITSISAIYHNIFGISTHSTAGQRKCL